MKTILDQIKEASYEKLVMYFVGVGSAFSKANDQTSLIIAKNGITVLVDLGTSIPKALNKAGISITDFDYYHFTHSHSDHIGGLEEMLFIGRYVTKQKPKVIITEHYQDILWEKSLKGGMEYSEIGLMKFSDFIQPIRPTWIKAQPREMYEIILDGGLKLTIFRTAHIPGFVSGWEQAFWSTGLMIDDKVIFSGDTRFDPLIFKDLPTDNIQAIFHDCQLFNPGAVHATFDELNTLPDNIKEKMYLVHYGDNFPKFEPQKTGFLGFTEANKIYTFSF